MFNSLDISTSALVAQRIRMTAHASNLANVSTTHNEQGQRVPYQPRYVIFETDESLGSNGAAGVRVHSVKIDDDMEPRYKYEPGHPDAETDGPMTGYVAYPGVNMMTEMTNAMEASRAYQANLGVIDVAKDMSQATLRILV